MSRRKHVEVLLPGAPVCRRRATQPLSNYSAVFHIQHSQRTRSQEEFLSTSFQSLTQSCNPDQCLKLKNNKLLTYTALRRVCNFLAARTQIPKSLTWKTWPLLILTHRRLPNSQMSQTDPLLRLPIKNIFPDRCTKPDDFRTCGPRCGRQFPKHSRRK